MENKLTDKAMKNWLNRKKKAPGKHGKTSGVSLVGTVRVKYIKINIITFFFFLAGVSLAGSIFFKSQICGTGITLLTRLVGHSISPK